MKHAVYNAFKYEKKLKQLERKKQRDNKRKAYNIYEMLESNKWASFIPEITNKTNKGSRLRLLFIA